MNENLQWLDDLFADPSKIIMVMDLPQDWGIKTEILQAHKDEIFPDREGGRITVSEGTLGTPRIEATYSNTPLARPSLDGVDGLDDNQKKWLSELPGSYLDAQEEILYRIELPTEQLTQHKANIEALLTTVGVKEPYAAIHDGRLWIEKKDLDTLRSIKDAGLKATIEAVKDMTARKKGTAELDPLDEDLLMGEEDAPPTAQTTQPQKLGTIISFTTKDRFPTS